MNENDNCNNHTISFCYCFPNRVEVEATLSRKICLWYVTSDIPNWVLFHRIYIFVIFWWRSFIRNIENLWSFESCYLFLLNLCSQPHSLHCPVLTRNPWNHTVKHHRYIKAEMEDYFNTSQEKSCICLYCYYVYKTYSSYLTHFSVGNL